MSKKLAFSKLNAKINIEEKSFIFNNQEVFVKQYLPIEEKMGIIDNIVTFSQNTHYRYFNPGFIDMIATLEIVFNYSNLSFTEKQLEDKVKLYDLLMSSGLAQQIANTIPYEELNSIDVILEKTLDNIYKHNNSALGLLEAVAEDYKEQDLNASEVQSKMANPEVVSMLKNVIANLG